MKVSRSSIDEPFHERYSHIFGNVFLYSPSGPPKTWGEKPWILVTERDGTNPRPIQVQLKAEYAMEAFNSPGLIWKTMLWEEPTSS